MCLLAELPMHYKYKHYVSAISACLSGVWSFISVMARLEPCIFGTGVWCFSHLFIPSYLIINTASSWHQCLRCSFSELLMHYNCKRYVSAWLEGDLQSGWSGNETLSFTSKVRHFSHSAIRPITLFGINSWHLQPCLQNQEPIWHFRYIWPGLAYVIWFVPTGKLFYPSLPVISSKFKAFSPYI